MRVLISKIKVKKRIRKELGNLTELSKSIEENGLINPIIINENYELLAGYRRLRAVKKLGWKDIEVKMVHTNDELDKLNIELEENLLRKDFTPLELQKGLNLKNELIKIKGMSPIKRFFYKLFKSITSFFYRLLKIEEY